jgi:hypothetical protein
LVAVINLIFMSNSKQKTIKIPRKPFAKSDQDHVLDVVLACSSQNVRDPASYADRKAFAQYIAESEDISPRIKEVLASLSLEEQSRLFR